MDSLSDKDREELIRGMDTPAPIRKHPYILPPPRFAEVWQMDAEHPGTVDQQKAVRDIFTLTYGDDRWKLMKRVDKNTNEIYRRSYCTIGFMPEWMFPGDMIAVAGPTGINFRADYAPSALKDQLPHEFGHLIDRQNLIRESDRVWFMHQISGPDLGDNFWNRSYQETFADAVCDWWWKRGWDSLTPILLAEEPAF